MYHVLNFEQGTAVLASYWEEYIKNSKYLKDHTELRQYQWKMYAWKYKLTKCFILKFKIKNVSQEKLPPAREPCLSKGAKLDSTGVAFLWNL